MFVASNSRPSVQIVLKQNDRAIIGVFDFCFRLLADRLISLCKKVDARGALERSENRCSDELVRHFVAKKKSFVLSVQRKKIEREEIKQ